MVGIVGRRVPVVVELLGRVAGLEGSEPAAEVPLLLRLELLRRAQAPPSLLLLLPSTPLLPLLLLLLFRLRLRLRRRKRL